MTLHPEAAAAMAQIAEAVDALARLHPDETVTVEVRTNNPKSGRGTETRARFVESVQGAVASEWYGEDSSGGQRDITATTPNGGRVTAFERRLPVAAGGAS